MNNLAIKRGDVFGSTNPMALGRAINFLQMLWAKDSESVYSHAGIFLSERKTLESLWTVKIQNFYDAYDGDNVIIARPKVVDKSIEYAINKIISKHFNQFYPFWRLPMHVIPVVAKIGVFERLVCSELVAKYLYLCGARHSQYKGTNPDSLSDEWHHWKNFEIIFEGRIES